QIARDIGCRTFDERIDEWIPAVGEQAHVEDTFGPAGKRIKDWRADTGKRNKGLVVVSGPDHTHWCAALKGAADAVGADAAFGEVEAGIKVDPVQDAACCR